MIKAQKIKITICFQFQKIVRLLLEKYSAILKMALTDIWVLLADSAENFFNSLYRFLQLFKEVNADDRLKRGKIKNKWIK